MLYQPVGYDIKFEEGQKAGGLSFEFCCCVPFGYAPLWGVLS